MMVRLTDSFGWFRFSRHERLTLRSGRLLPNRHLKDGGARLYGTIPFVIVPVRRRRLRRTPLGSEEAVCAF